MSRDTCDRTCVSPHTCKIPVSTSLLACNSTCQIRTLLSQLQHYWLSIFAFITPLSCFILNEPFDMLQQQETLYVGYTNPGSHVQFQIIKRNCLYRLGRTCKLKSKSWTNFFRAWTTDLMWIPTIRSTSFGLQALSYGRIFLWNTQDESIKNEPSLLAFKVWQSYEWGITL